MLLSPSPLTRSPKSAKILIVDDEPTNLTALSRILAHDGYSACVSMTDPRKAIEHAVATPPDLLLLDWHMGLLSGGDVLAELRHRLPVLAMPPAIVLTSDDSPATRRDALAAGATDFLSKPLDHIEVLLRIQNLLQLQALHRHVQNENRSLEEKIRERTAQLEKSLADLEELQGQIIEQERLRALGAMAGGIAHDFNNVLMIIRGYSDMLRMHEHLRRDPVKIDECLKTISSAASDATEIVRRLREFSRPYNKEDGGEEHKSTDVNTVVEEAVRLTVPKWKTQTQAIGVFIDLQMQLSHVAPINGAASELREVLINLIFNAVDAMPQGGQILIRTGMCDGQVFFEVQDTGTGMTEETRRQCFEPFYTTKGDKGTGLGLSTTYGIVRRHGGLLRLHTELNRGSTFTVLLPALEAAATSADVLALPALAHPLRVLIVDDQPDICRVLSSYLAQDAHTVVTAGNGCDALEKFRTGQFDLVITDRAMPKMNGDQLASAIREIKPTEPIILMTAFTEPRRPSSDVSCLIRKPFSLRTVREAICKVVAA